MLNLVQGLHALLHDIVVLYQVILLYQGYLLSS